jgi:predicted hydrocarbon binding protein
MDLSGAQLLEIAQFSIIRMDGAWFMALARELGVETAWKMDVEAWKQFSYVFGKKIKKDFISEPKWPDSFLEATEILFRIMKIKGRKVINDKGTITIQVTECEVQKAIAKAGIADCGIATIHTYEGIVRGLFGKDVNVTVKHTKNLNRGDEGCEVVVST